MYTLSSHIQTSRFVSLNLLPEPCLPKCVHSVFQLFYKVKSVLITNSTELSPSSEAAKYAATKEFPNILWTPKVH
jgi:hypothetical protein